MALQDIPILVSTMTGTAEMIAEDMAACVGERWQPHLLLAENASLEVFSRSRLFLVVSSTYGTGEIPDPAKPLHAQLLASGLDLGGLGYGVVSLGDHRVYPNTFANGGKLWDAALAARGANRMLETLLLDASGPDDMSTLAVQWISRWLDIAEEADGPLHPGTAQRS
jgi:MioC protein